MASASSIMIVLVNWHGAKDTIACLRSINSLQSSASRVSIVIVDNASTDDSLERLEAEVFAQGYLPKPNLESNEEMRRKGQEAWYVSVRQRAAAICIVRTRRNLGFAGGNNVGTRVGRAVEHPDFVWYLNNDTEVAPDCLDRLLERTASDPRIGICGATILYFDSQDIVQEYGGTRYSLLTGRGAPVGNGTRWNPETTNSEVEERISYVSGASMFVRAAFLDEVGLMAEDYFLYSEEIDWAYRARGRFRLGVETAAIVRHKEGAAIGTEGRRDGSPLATFYQARSKLLFARKHTPQFLATVWLALVLRCIKMAIRGRRQAALVIAQVLLGREEPSPEWFARRVHTA